MQSHSPGTPFPSGTANNCSPGPSTESTECFNINHQGIKSSPKVKMMREFNLQDCCTFLKRNELERFIPQFLDAEMDGPLLISLAHPMFNESILSGMGITDKCEQIVLINLVKEHSS